MLVMTGESPRFIFAGWYATGARRRGFGGLGGRCRPKWTLPEHPDSSMRDNNNDFPENEKCQIVAEAPVISTEQWSRATSSMGDWGTRQ